MISAPTFLDACHARGFRFITGTPCSYLKPLINAAIDDTRFVFRDATNEGDAVAMAAGATLAGVRAVVMFQNSGLGNAVNALTSLCYPFRVPILIIVTHRGEPGGEADEPQHEQMGRITTALLDTMEIPWRQFPERPEDVSSVLEQAVTEMNTRRQPFALVMRKGAVGTHALQTRLPDVAPPCGPSNCRKPFHVGLPSVSRGPPRWTSSARRGIRERCWWPRPDTSGANCMHSGTTPGTSTWSDRWVRQAPSASASLCRSRPAP